MSDTQARPTEEISVPSNAKCFLAKAPKSPWPVPKSSSDRSKREMLLITSPWSSAEKATRFSPSCPLVRRTSSRSAW